MSEEHAPAPSSNLEPSPSKAAGPHAGGVERRRHRRFRVDGLVGVACPAFEPEGGYVSVRRRSLRGLISGPTELERLNDLSRGGLSFETQERFAVGQRVRLSLFVRHWCEPMELLGEVRWVRSIYRDMLDIVGVQFNAFGHGRECNPPEALEALARLEMRYVDA